MDGILFLIILVLGLAAGLLAGKALFARPKTSAAKTDIKASIEHMRSIGQLSAFKVVTKEIVTETDHSWGEFGQKYMRWVLSSKKMAMIFEFEIDFRYNLRSDEFQIESTGDQGYTIRMPPCFHEAHIRDIQFYDEQAAKLLPWLLPDLLNGFIRDGFSEQDKNRLVAAARKHAEQLALKWIRDLEPEVQQSARTTLQSIARAFGAEKVFFDFGSGGKVHLNIDVAAKVAA